jgi:hypothetical protein
MLSFKEAASLFAKARSKTRGYRLPGRCGYTRLIQVDADSYAVRLHRTNVVSIHRDGTYTLNTGGWHTKVTRDRINTYSPARLATQNNEPYIDGRRWKRDKFVGPTWEYRDGMRVNATGVPLDVNLVDLSERKRAYNKERYQAKKLRLQRERELDLQRNPWKATTAGQAAGY